MKHWITLFLIILLLNCKQKNNLNNSLNKFINGTCWYFSYSIINDIKRKGTTQSIGSIYCFEKTRKFAKVSIFDTTINRKTYFQGIKLGDLDYGNDPNWYVIGDTLKFPGEHSLLIRKINSDSIIITPPKFKEVKGNSVREYNHNDIWVWKRIVI